MTEPTVTKNADGSITRSYKLSEMTSDQLALLIQAKGRERDKIREDMAKLQALLRERLKKERVAHLQKEVDALQASMDGEAPGAVIEALANKAG